MIQFKKILVPVDGSEHSLLAKRKAMSIAAAMGSDVVLMYATGKVPGLIGGAAREELKEELAKEGEGVLAPFRKVLAEKGVAFSERIVSGDPGEVICKTAKEEGCDLIVMGSRGLSDFEGMVLGSVTHRVLSTCTLPVLVAR